MPISSVLKSMIVDLARRRGYDVTPEWKLANKPLVRHLKALFARYRVDCVLDVGGNLGQYRDLIREDVEFPGPIVSFEPVGRYAEILMKRAEQDPSWTICRYALGRSPGSAEINVTRSPGLNSFLAPRNDMVEGFWADNSVTGSETVEIQTIDAVLPELKARIGFERPYLKLDTQGFDLQVLEGALESLSSVVGYQTEASVLPIYAEMPTHFDAIRFGIDHGFDLSNMFPVSIDYSVRLVEFDCVFVDSKKLQPIAVPTAT